MKIELELLEITTLQNVIRGARTGKPYECSPMQKDLNRFRTLERGGLIQRNINGTYWFPTKQGEEVLRQSLPITTNNNLNVISPSDPNNLLNKRISY